MTRKIPTAALYEPGTKTIRSVPENYWLATMDSWDGAVDHDATAKVFAASFEMLAALRGMIEAYWRGSEDSDDADAPSAVKAALAAIAKAEA